ncbi:MAG: RNA polymerase sigma factor [Armatimonadetes bacterium]|nr:RNA polymerase sigma factor [Armatimonadota bacterium]
MKTGRLDTKLLEAAHQGDVVALESLLILCRPDLRRYAALTCLTSADAEDAVQEALMIVYRKVSALRSVGTFSQWIFQIVRRECLRIIQPKTIGLEIIQEKAYLDAHSDTELRFDLTRAIQSLSPIYREVLVLRDFEELTIQEIAQRLELPPETAKTRLYRGRNLVREYLLA